MQEIVPTENKVCEHYLTSSGALMSTSTIKSNRYFKANCIRDDLMFDQNMSKYEQVINWSISKIIRKLKSMAVSLTEKQKQLSDKKGFVVR